MIENKKEVIKKWIGLAILFFLSVFVRYLISDYERLVTIVPDEAYYFSIAKSIATGNGIQVYNTGTSFQSVLYSLVLSPAFLVSDTSVTIKLVGLINAVLMSLGIFPVYLLAKKYLKNQKWIWYVCILFCCFSDLCYSMTYMIENLFVPMGLWAVWFLSWAIEKWDAFLEGNKRSGKIWQWALLGVYLYAVYLCKSVGLAFAFALGIYLLVTFGIHWKRNGLNKELITGTIIRWIAIGVGFIAPWLILKLTLFTDTSSGGSLLRYDPFENLFNLYYIFYAFIYYLIIVVFAYGVIPFVIPVIERKNMLKKDMHFFWFLVLLGVSTAGAVSILITGVENAGETIPRIHLRYVCYLFIPMVIMMLNAIEHAGKLHHKGLVIGTGCACALYVYLTIMGDNVLVPAKECMDQTMVQFLSQNMDSQSYLVIGYCAVLMIVVLLLWKWKKAGTVVFAALLLGVNLWNSVLTIHMWRNEGNELSEEGEVKKDWIESFVSEHADETILVLSENGGSGAYLTMYADEENVYTIKVSDLQTYIEDGNDMTWSEAESSLNAPIADSTYTDLDEVDWILCREDMGIEFDENDVEEEDTALSGMKLYHVNNSESIPGMTFTYGSITSTDQIDDMIDNALKKHAESQSLQGS